MSNSIQTIATTYSPTCRSTQPQPPKFGDDLRTAPMLFEASTLKFEVGDFAEFSAVLEVREGTPKRSASDTGVREESVSTAKGDLLIPLSPRPCPKSFVGKRKRGFSPAFGEGPRDFGFMFS
ncbi:hypothetical protein VTL71DRAFT_9442 [Oculimacula yallundae]|uniref:Uncharacterized protein n=1 Tax=Oculimacula yallundae TaxID=86028 RepID=A0ABR4BRV9_9HELO